MTPPSEIVAEAAAKIAQLHQEDSIGWHWHIEAIVEAAIEKATAPLVELLREFVRDFGDEYPEETRKARAAMKGEA